MKRIAGLAQALAGSEGEDGTPKTAAIYARTSTPKQRSIPQQVRICRDRCEQLNFRVRYILKEEAQSAKDLERPKLQHLLHLCETQRVDVVVVWKLDRLVRSLRDLLNMYRHLESLGVSLVSVTEQFDTSTPFGRFAFRNIASAAELERELISERARMGKVAQAIKGRWPTQRPPLGYRLGKDRRLEVDREEAKVARRIFRWYANGVPLTEITRRLGEAGVLTRRGKSYSPTAVRAIVNNPVYRGKVEVLSLKHEREDLRLIGEKTWEKVEARKGKRCRDENEKTRRERAMDAVLEDYMAYLLENETTE